MSKRFRLVLLWISIFGISLFNYTFAKHLQNLLIEKLSMDYEFALILPWTIIAIIPVLFSAKDSGLKFTFEIFKKNYKRITIYTLIIITGLILFKLIGVVNTFKYVKYPIIFFIFTPIIEELIFRGFVQSKLTKYYNANFAVVFSAILFGLHHLQYFDYKLSLFAVFQVSYTFIAGLLLGSLRKESGNIYIGLSLHMIMNFVSVYF
jgi:membrane protease YdiL (CAAX protease family)